MLSLTLRSLQTSPIRGLVIEQHHALFRHVANRIARPFAADAGVLHPAIGELVGAPSRAAVDDNAAGAQVSDRPNREFGRGGENSGLQPEAAVADAAEYGINVVIGQDADDRPEHLVADDLHVGPDPADHGWFDLRAPAPAARLHRGTASRRFMNPGFHALCGRYIDQCADV